MKRGTLAFIYGNISVWLAVNRGLVSKSRSVCANCAKAASIYTKNGEKRLG